MEVLALQHCAFSTYKALSRLFAPICSHGKAGLRDHFVTIV